MNPMIENPLTWMYFPTALLLGALHALEPGHAKTLTAAYLIGIKGTKWDAFFLGLSVALTHSLVVVGISVAALWIGQETFTQDVTRWLQLGSGVVVVMLGAWLMIKRILQMRRQSQRSHHHHDHGHDHSHHDHSHDHGDHHHHDHKHEHHHHHDEDDHSLLSDDEHARAHAAAMPEYAKRGERPTVWQIITFGAAGGMIPCPASITVMLLSLSIGKIGAGLFAVAGFSLGLAVTLVGIGLIVVAGLSRLNGTGKFHWISSKAPIISAGIVMLSGLAALVFAH